MCPQVQTDGQAGIRNLVYPAPLSSRSPTLHPASSHVFLPLRTLPLFLFLALLPCRALSMVISTERRRLSFQPSFHSTLQQPTSPRVPLLPLPLPPSPTRCLLLPSHTLRTRQRIRFCGTGSEDSSSGMCGGAGIFISEGAPKTMSRER